MLVDRPLLFESVKHQCYKEGTGPFHENKPILFFFFFFFFFLFNKEI